MKYDPTEQLRTLPSKAILIAHGSTDLQVGIADARLLADARLDARLLIVEGMNHVLKAADGSTASHNEAYTNPDLPVVPELIRELAEFAR